ncbi:hypothetical protein EMO89_02755 [Bifidobacterium tissieri]|uniref:Uncharacterized protein n=1 Tax=Bifidobacterium tissieri TaxID=1630162 RepID=A0A5M9ZVR9_9BIFI|nr:hypothetical protein [Bifidobacterium tissieri]KAA8831660.1 hypothetical protein EMO89_02755 [Bifidobacterium tissieri]
MQDLTVFAGKTLVISQTGIPTGMQVVFDIYDKAGKITYLVNGYASCPADAPLVQLRVQATVAAPPTVDFDLRVQVEEGIKASAWERPVTVDWPGGGVLRD